MKVIYKGRGRGKTYDMIKLASENKGYILCSTFQQAQHIYDLSKDMGVSIHFPITYADLPLTKGQRIDSVLIDNAEKAHPRRQNYLNGTLYHQSGNSIVVDVLEAIFKELIF